MDVLLFLFGLSCLVRAGYIFTIYLQTRQWKAIAAEVLDASIKKKQRYDIWGIATYYYPKITYRYQIGGRLYTNTRFGLLPLAKNKQEIEVNWLEPAKMQSHINVFYDPYDAEKALIDRELTPTLRNTMIILCTVGIVFWIAAFI